jgi:hypothetical protein
MPALRLAAVSCDRPGVSFLPRAAIGSRSHLQHVTYFGSERGPNHTENEQWFRILSICVAILAKAALLYGTIEPFGVLVDC